MNIVYLGSNREYSRYGAKLVKKFFPNNSFIHNKNNALKNFPIKYDLGIALGYMHLVKKNELKKATWINIHPGPLPKYGGRNIAYHALMNNEKSFGATLHYMSAEFDAGDIICVKNFDIYKGTTAKELYQLSCQASLDLLEEFLPKILNGEELKSSQQKDRRYYPKETINNTIEVDENIKKSICALYYPPHYPQIKIGNKTFNIILEGQNNSEED